MAMVADFIAGKAFEALYASIQQLIGKNLISKSLFIETRSKLDSLKPLIEKMAQYNQQLDLPKKELEAFEVLMKDGLELVLNCSELRQYMEHLQEVQILHFLNWMSLSKNN